MASERATAPVQANRPPSIREAPRDNNADPNTTPSSQARESFISRDGSPSRRQSPPQLNTGDANYPPITVFPLSPTSVHRHGDADSFGRQDIQEVGAGQPLPPFPGAYLADTQFGPRRRRTVDVSAAPQSVRLSRAVSGQYDPGEKPRSTVSDRIRKTVEDAERERAKYAAKAQMTGLALNIAIGLQVLLGSLTTGLSAVAGPGRSAAVQTTILGALATLVASYLARARGSNEPELSITRVKDLEQFLRECRNFETDHGLHTGHEYDEQLAYYRQRFEELLGNANGERKLSPD
ncbi:hypothetical protein BDZ97DRAFT_1913536 [Flammula alnicola]|nr:hypothetical protein BDZ97DRAFT_1913536 [Flammula alnicola]